MTRGIPERPARIGKRWPYRFLDLLPPKQLWRFLLWNSGGDRPDPTFEIRPALAGAHRILAILPESPSDFLLTLPILQAHFQSLPEAAIWILAGPGESPFLASIFGKERVLTLDPRVFHYGEEGFKDLQSRIRGMRPDLVINFRSPCPPLLQFLVRSSASPLRVHLDPAVKPPFSNISLAPTDPPNRFRHYQMVTRLWEAAGTPLNGKWSRLTPTPESQGRAELLLKAAGLKPGQTLLFPWQDKPAKDQAALLAEVAKQARAKGQSIAVLLAEGGPFASPPPPATVADGYPCLRTDTPGTLLGLFAVTAGTVGMRGPLLLLAGLTDADVTGYFGEEDAAYDTSAWNGRMRVLNLPEIGEKSKGKS